MHRALLIVLATLGLGSNRRRVLDARTSRSPSPDEWGALSCGHLLPAFGRLDIDADGEAGLVSDRLTNAEPDQLVGREVFTHDYAKVFWPFSAGVLHSNAFVEHPTDAARSKAAKWPSQSGASHRKPWPSRKEAVAVSGHRNTELMAMLVIVSKA